MNFDAAGNLYGTTSQGGAANDGSVFEIGNRSSVLTTLVSFSTSQGGAGDPYAGLMLDAAGDLFGTTVDGGSASGGTVFEIPAESTTVTTLANFQGGAEGSGPECVPILDAQGHIYGTTLSGGPSGAGTVFELTVMPDVALAPTSGPNPSITSQPLAFTATVSNGVPDRETVSLQDVGSNTVVATGTLNAGNGSGYTQSNPNAPEGTQVAYLQQNNASMSQTVSLAAGTYTANF